MPEDTNDGVNEVKKSIEEIIGAPTFLKQKRKTVEDLQREQFVQIIESIEKLLSRTDKLSEFMDITFYEQPFYQLIDDMFIIMFGENTHQVIAWYLYGQYNEDGSRTQLVDNDEKVIPLETPLDLWNFVKSHMEQQQKRKPKK